MGVLAIVLAIMSIDADGGWQVCLVVAALILACLHMLGGGSD